MKRFFGRCFSLALLGAMMLGMSQVAKANLVLNGSFEDPIVPPGFYTNFPGSSTAITPWTVVGVDSAVVSTTFSQQGITFQAQHGNQWIDLAGATGNSQTSGVRQSVATTMGQLYNLSFWVGSASDVGFNNQGPFFFPTTVDLSINGGARVSYTNPNLTPNTAPPSNAINWLNFTTQFVASSSTTTITFFNGGASNNWTSSLDNVSMTAVPELSTMASWGLMGGIGAIFATRFNRKRLQAQLA